MRPFEKLKLISVFLLLTLLTGNCLQAENQITHTSLDSLQLELEPVADNLFRPIGVTHAGDGSGWLYIVLQSGQIMIYDGVSLVEKPFLNIGGKVACCGERGLLGLAFHPNYAQNGYFYVNYFSRDEKTVIARYARSDDPKAARRKSEKILLTQDQPHSNHNGGQLRFGPKGYLYIAFGDSGIRAGPANPAQDLGDWLGKMLRIDVDNGSPYAIPPGNPFVGVRGARPEIWALGFRNPWGFSFDRKTGDLFIADAGHKGWEEIDYEAAGGPGGANYAWSRMEGTSCYNPSTNCQREGDTLPILEYGRSRGNCVAIGGYRYRGKRFPKLDGVYLFGDHCSGRIWGAIPDENGKWVKRELIKSGLSISAFGEDQNGEIYVTDVAKKGGVYRILLMSPAL